MSKLPVSQVVRTSVNLAPAGAKAQSLSDMLILGTSAIIDTTERMRTYPTLTALALDFGTTAEEYKSAVPWFSQTPQPTQIRVGRWCKTASSGGLKCAASSDTTALLAALKAITTGAFKYTKDAGSETAVSALDFSGAANLNAVAALIQAALTGVAVVWSATALRFEFTSATTGVASAVSFLSAPASGADISVLLGGRATSSGAYLFQGTAAEALDATLALFDDRFGQQWMASVAPAADNDAHLLAAAWTEAATNKHAYGLTTQEAGVLLASVTDDIASQLHDLGYKRSLVQYSSKSAYAVSSALGRILTTDYSSANTVGTLMFKQEPGIEPEELSATQAATAKAKCANAFVEYDNDTNILQYGTMADGTFADVIFGTDWLALDIQRAVYNVLYTTTTKIPQTDKGVNVLQTAIVGRCAQGVLNGLIAPGTWNSDGFGQLAQGDYMATGYYVWALPIDLQDPADRTQRKAPPFKVAIKLAGAIHSADVEITVNQ